MVSIMGQGLPKTPVGWGKEIQSVIAYQAAVRICKNKSALLW